MSVAFAPRATITDALVRSAGYQSYDELRQPVRVEHDMYQKGVDSAEVDSEGEHLQTAPQLVI